VGTEDIAALFQQQPELVITHTHPRLNPRLSDTTVKPHPRLLVNSFQADMFRQFNPNVLSTGSSSGTRNLSLTS
jgi:hypothetical protein